MVTRAEAAAPALTALERAGPGRSVALAFGPHALGRAVVRARFVAVLEDAFDRVLPRLQPAEQVVYLQLYRLAFGHERNHCRVSRAELAERTGLSALRLQNAIAGLVALGHIAAVDRSRAGTLYRVLLPFEIFGEPTGDSVLLPKRPPTDLHEDAPPAIRPLPLKPPRVARAKADTEGPSPIESVGGVCAWFLKFHGKGRGFAPEQVVDEVQELVERGLSLAQVRTILERFARELPRHTPLSELGRFAAQLPAD